MKYNDVATFVKVESNGYRGTKVLMDEAEVNVIFIQNTALANTDYQENVDADAICYPDIDNQFIISNVHRLEGIYVLMPLFGSDSDISWYKITSVTINRDHLLCNNIDNVQCFLKKTEPIGGVS